MADYDTDEPETAEADPGRTDDSLLRRIRRWERQARNHWSKWREEARRSYAFHAGDQWTSEDKAALLDQMRQPVTFNRVGPMVDAVTGAEILNRQEVRYMPREQGDVQVSELVTAADEWSRDLADTEDEESDAFGDVVICGLGWTETRMDYSIDPEGRIVDERIDPLEMWAVPNGAFQRNLGNSRCLVRARYRDKDSLPPAWRKKLPTAIAGNSQDDPATGWTGPRDDYEREDEPHRKEAGADRREVWVRHVQWWDEEPVWRIADPMTGQAATLTRQQLRQVNAMFISNGMKPPEAMEIQTRKYYQAVICGSVFLEEKTEIEAGAFTFKCITGKRDRNTNTFYGAVRAMIDPQMWGNKFFVQILDILNTAAKGGIMYEQDSFANPRKALEDWSNPRAPIEMKRGALSGQNAMVKERPQVVWPAGTERLMEFVHNMMPQTSGINMELLGLVERDQPGVLEAQRKKAGYAILAVFFDSLRRYRKEKGRVRLYFIQHYISDGRLVRIKGRDATMQYVPLVREPGVSTYDVIVDEAPMSPNQKEQTWLMIQAMLPMLAKLNVPIEVWAKILEYSPLPSSVSAEIGQMLAQKAQEPPPPDPEMMKVQAQLEARKAELEMDAQAQQQQAALEREKAEQELAIEREKAQIEMRKAAVDLQIQREKGRLDIEATYAKIDADMAMAQQKAATQAQADEQKLDAQRAKDEQAVAAAMAKARAAPKRPAKAA
ncbi:MAG TPA: hypothetical protein VG758_18565 [Hyphomicrobiaceae bacterium]|nr:hypothetical protein [Hyphomicrobiaceae bacterium]